MFQGLPNLLRQFCYMEEHHTPNCCYYNCLPHFLERLVALIWRLVHVERFRDWQSCSNICFNIRLLIKSGFRNCFSGRQPDMNGCKLLRLYLTICETEECTMLSAERQYYITLDGLPVILVKSQ